jgi:Protein of unknown function (DUF2628)
MPSFTVHAPPLRSGESAADPERFVFVRDGFYFWAFALAPLWLLVHRLWLALLGYIVVYALLGVSFYFLGVPQAAGFVAALLIDLLVGFEAATLWRWTLSRRGWRSVGFATGKDIETAEHRFFAAWAARKPATIAPPTENFAPPVRRGPPSASDVLGLFPEPGGPR